MSKKDFWYFGKNYQWKSSLGLTFLHFEFKSLYFHNWGKNLSFLVKYLDFWPAISKYRFENSKCRKVKPKFDFHWQFLLRMHSKASEFTQNQTEIDKTFSVQCFFYLPKHAQFKQNFLFKQVYHSFLIHKVFDLKMIRRAK